MDLAYNINGEAFEVPDSATGWRVRRMKPRGAPEVVYGKDGIPLIVPVDSDLVELRRNVDAPGRFRLDAVDDRGRTIEDVPPAYLMVATMVDDDDGVVARAKTPVREDEGAVREAMRLNTELAKSVIDRFPEMMHAAAELLRAADGAGLPARHPRAVEDVVEDEDPEDDEAAPASPGGELLNTLLAQVLPILMTSMANKKMPKLDTILDWRKATPEARKSKVTATEPTPDDDVSEETPSEAPPLDAKMMSHFIAIQSALAPEEAAFARQIGAELSPAELRAWIEELSAMSVPDAVAKVRSIVGKGGAS